MPVSSPRLGATRIVILGGGYVGMYTALTLQKKLRGAIRKGDVHVTVVDPSSVMTYQPFLAEASAGSLEPRHVVVPLRQVLKKCTIITGFVSSISAAKRYVRVEPIEGEPYDLFFDHLVVCPGSVSRTLPIPGLADVGLGFKSVAEAIYLRNRVLGQLDAASSTDQADIRRKALSFVVIGGGYAGIELLAELEDFSRSALKFYPTIGQEELHWHLVEATGRILAEVSESLGQYTVTQLEKRDIAVHLNVKVKDLTGGHVVLDDGTEFDSQTIMWTAGVKPNPVVGRSDLPVDSKGRLKCHPTLEVEGHHNVWGAGDSAAVPDLSKAAGEFCGPSAQHAVRQARQLGKNIARAYSGHGPNDYKHKYVGSVASLGSTRASPSSTGSM